MANSYLLLAPVILVLLFQGACSITYQVIDKVPQTPGGIRFEKEIGVDYTIQTLGTINEFIYNMFDQVNNPDDRRPQTNVTLFIDIQAPGDIAGTLDNVINMSSIYIQNFQGDVKWFVTSVLYHEMTHVFQWMPSNGRPGLIEGIADYTMLKANYYPDGLAKPGDGEKWDDGYDVTARFLEYCESLLGGFVAQPNKKMKDSYDDGYFVDLLGKPVDQIWKEYKDKYKNI